MLLTLGSKTTSEEMRRMMAELDQNGDGYIDLKEFADRLHSAISHRGFHLCSAVTSAARRSATTATETATEPSLAWYQLHLVKAEKARAYIPKEFKLVEAFGSDL